MYPNTSQDTDFKESRLINLLEEIPELLKIQVMAWELFSNFSQIHSQNQMKAVHKNLKKTQKVTMNKIRVKGYVAAEETDVIQ